MVVWLSGIQCLHILVVQRSLTVLRPSQAFHDIICECKNTTHDFVKDIYMSLYTQKKQVAGEVSLTPGTVITEWLVSLKNFRGKGILR